MALLEIQMNHLGINSIEISHKDIDVSVGTPLHVRMTNYGVPTHVTLKTEGSAYTAFTYENIYLESQAEVNIPILSSANAGTFVLNVISGYGMRKADVNVNVIMAEPEPVQEAPAEVPVMDEEVKPKRPHKAGRVIAALILPVVSLALILAWYFYLGPHYPAIPPLVVVAVVYVLMLAGIAVAWLSAR